MDINTIWNSIVIIKIRRDDSYNFTLKEIEAFAQVYNMDVEDFCTNVLKLSKQQNSSNSFDIEQLKSLGVKLGINLNDLCTNILGISRNMLNRFKNGEFKTVSSKKYETDKADYLNGINEDILEYILSSKGEKDFSSKFLYDEIMHYL